jgi:hypothetical protein
VKPNRCSAPWFSGRFLALRFWPSWARLCCALFTLAASAKSAGPFPGRFVLEADDVVVFTGGANVVAAQENGYLESLLTLNFARVPLRFRNMGWEGDTVYEQRRDLNFGPWSQQFKKVEASVLFAQFGQMESLQGAAALPQFLAAYAKLLDEFARQTPRIVLVSLLPFERSGPLGPDLAKHNDDVRLFAHAIRDLARQRGYLFVDLLHLGGKPFQGRLTSDGVYLTAHGQWEVARATALDLGLANIPRRITPDSATGELRPTSLERLRQAILAKNRLWFDYWRPMNWAFLRGDRTEQPSSHDHRNPKIRWFPEEMERFLPLIETEERRIAELTSTAAHELKLKGDQ